MVATAWKKLNGRCIGAIMADDPAIIEGKRARNNYQLEARIYGTTAADCIELLEGMIKQITDHELISYARTSAGLFTRAGGYVVLQHDPGFIFDPRGSAFHNWLNHKFSGYDPDGEEEDERRND